MVMVINHHMYIFTFILFKGLTEIFLGAIVELINILDKRLQNIQKSKEDSPGKQIARKPARRLSLQGLQQGFQRYFIKQVSGEYSTPKFNKKNYM